MNAPVALPANISIANARLPATYEAAKTALAECANLDECVDWSNKADALASYAKQAEDETLHRFATRIRARAISRAGELLKQIDPARGANQNIADGDDHKVMTRKDAGAAGRVHMDQPRMTTGTQTLPLRPGRMSPLGDGGGSMSWEIAHRADPRCVALADRHYSRQKPGSPQFVPPGRCLVLYAKTATGEAVWVTSWPFAEYVKHAWAGAWVCSIFRNEGAGLASDLIRDAVAATRAYYGEPPALGIITFVLPKALRSVNPGACFKHAGWRTAGAAKDGKPCLQLLPADMPAPAAPHGFQHSLEAA